MPSRLDYEFHDLEVALAAADERACRRVAEAAAVAAVQDAALADDTIARALECVRKRVPDDPQMQAEIEGLVARLDEAYWESEAELEAGTGTDSASRLAFKRARAANAVLYLLSDDATAAAQEAAYEAHHVLRDPDRLRSIVHAALG
jgi:hypothetical protein